jgi:hypothetical protein
MTVIIIIPIMPPTAFQMPKWLSEKEINKEDIGLNRIEKNKGKWIL